MNILPEVEKPLQRYKIRSVNQTKCVVDLHILFSSSSTGQNIRHDRDYRIEKVFLNVCVQYMQKYLFR